MYTGKPSKYSVDEDDWQSRLYIPPGMEGLTAVRGDGSRQLQDAVKRAERRRRLEERSANLLTNSPLIPSDDHQCARVLHVSNPHSSQIDLSSQVSPVATGSRSCAASHVGTTRPINSFASGEVDFQPESSGSISHTDWFCQPTHTHMSDPIQTAPAFRCLSPEQTSFDPCDFGFQPTHVNMSPYSSLPLMSKSHDFDSYAKSQSSAYKEEDAQQITDYDYDLRQLRNWPDFDKMQYDPHCNDQEGVTTSDECLKREYDFDFDS